MTPTPPRRGPASGRAADLTADLMVDLTAPGPLPSAPPAPPASSVPTPGGTPALSVTLTPLRWRLPALLPVENGMGVAVRVGPLRVEVGF